MSSPVEIPIQSLVQLDFTSKSPIYLQIATQLINAIQRQFLLHGNQLPGTRQMSSMLKVHRNTIVKAYDELEAQGWIEKIPNVGCFVLAKSSYEKVRFQPKNASLQLYPTQCGFRFEKSTVLDFPSENEENFLSLNDGLPDIRLTEVALSSRLYSSNLNRKTNRSSFAQTSLNGNLYFRKNLSNYLNLSRGLHISSNQITISRSLEMCIYIATEIILRPKDVVVVAALSYYVPNMIFNQKGAKVLTIPVDEEGLDVDALRIICEQQTVRMLYLTPHHHYPTTVTLSAARRIALLELAEKYGFVILEDDFDYDFHFDRHPLLPLASADQYGRVIYIGSFGKSLAPGFRTGFLVAPEDFILETKKYLNILDRQGDVLMEQVLGELIEEGNIHRYLKKANKIYKERRDFLAEILEKELASEVRFTLPSGGLAVWIEFINPINLMKLKENAKALKLFIPQHILYQNQQVSAMRMGFGHINLDEIREIVSILKLAIIQSKIK